MKIYLNKLQKQCFIGFFYAQGPPTFFLQNGHFELFFNHLSMHAL